MAYVIATANMKGGVGKTTLSVNLAAALAKDYGKRVLVFDLDTQISATLGLMSPNVFAKHRKEKRTLKQLLEQTFQINNSNSINIKDAIHYSICQVKNFDLLPGDIELYDEFVVAEMLHEEAFAFDKLDFQFVWNRFERNLITGILKPVIDDYDFIILDCAPGYNLMTRSGLFASDYYLLPMKPEPLSVIGVQLLKRRIDELKRIHESEGGLAVEMLGIVFTMSGNFITGTGMYHRKVMQRIAQDFDIEKIFKTQIPLDIAVAKAFDSFMPVVLSNPQSTGAKSFVQLTQDFLQKLNDREQKNQQLATQNLAAIG
ncbi:MAG: ParA family protein [Cyanosarcina radialis HA8281-LM2]|jgi:cellulose biosynthesis protein BcsQ|nr:ParA family protein [Cyanosarcina radialis HA8281-LM2]